MSADNDGQIACYRCGNATVLAGQIQPLGHELGSQIYRCTSCDELTWTPISRGFRYGNTEPGQPVQQQQQQLQPQQQPVDPTDPKKDES